jgi:hypothetical protein
MYRSEGTTASERYLAKLCQKSFLSLWSYPNVFRDQGRHEQFRNLAWAQPFRPFVMHLAEGREVPVHHPDFLATSPSGRTVVVYQPDHSLNIVDLSSIFW